MTEFRQDKNNPQKNQAALDAIHAFQKAAGTNVPDAAPSNMPPKIQEMLNKYNASQPQTQMSQEPQPVIQPSKLQELLEGIKKFSFQYEEVSLPSLGKFYNGSDGPVNGIVHIRPMTGNEEDILANSRIVRKGNSMTEIFSRCMQEKYNVDNFLTEDRYYLMIYLRGISFGTDYDAEVTCSSCSEKFPIKIDLDQDLELNVCPEEFNIENTNDVLPITGYKFSYRFPREIDNQSISGYRNKKLQDFGAGVANDSFSFRLSLYVKDIEGVSDQRSIQLLLKQLPANDINYIRDLVYNPPFGVKTDVKTQCPLCLSEIETTMPIDLNFFFPKAKRATKQA